MDATRHPVAGRDGLAVLDAEEIRRALTRIAHEILERTHGGDEVVLLGIPTRGVPLARRLAARIGEFEGLEVPCGSLDVTMHRDDLRLRPARALGRTDLPASGVDGKTVVLVDDVLYSGRTVRAALDALTDLGRPGPCNWPSWSTAAIASSPSAPTTWARTCRPLSGRWCTSCWRRSTRRTR